jgi:hypothetical protein
MNGWATVYEGNRIQAEIIASALDAAGIRVEVFGDTAYGALMDARVFVPEEQLEAARRVLKEG